jgi:hypothetical protein
MYRYLDCPDDEDGGEEEEFDLVGNMKMPTVGDLVYRRDKIWKIVEIYAIPASDPVLHFRVHLTDMAKTQYLN